MLRAVTGLCPDCGDERILLPTGDVADPSLDYCCTACDAAVLLLPVPLPPPLPRPVAAS